MSGNITWEMLVGLIGIFGVVAAVWRHFQNQVGNVDADLQAYKLYVAERYASAEFVTREFAAVSKSISDVGDRMEKRLDGMNERLDRVIEAGKPRVL